MIAYLTKETGNKTKITYSVEYKHNTFSPGPGLEPGISVLDIKFHSMKENEKQISKISKIKQDVIDKNFPDDEDAYFCAKEDYEIEIARFEDV